MMLYRTTCSVYRYAVCDEGKEDQIEQEKKPSLEHKFIFGAYIRPLVRVLSETSLNNSPLQDRCLGSLEV